MGYDMSIENPDPVAVARKQQLWEQIYGNGTGLITKLNKLIEAGEASEKKESDNPFEFYPFWEAYEETGGTEEFHYHLTALKALFAEHLTVEAETYFRLNIWGMGRCRSIMYDRGMVHNIGNHPDWPEPSDYGLDEWPENVQYDDDYNEIGPWPIGSPEANFNAAREAVLSYSPSATLGIPSWKLGSNDGWHVTEDDCTSALVALKNWATGEVGTKDEDIVRAKMVEPPIVRFSDGEGPATWWPDWVQFLETASTHGGFRTY